MSHGYILSIQAKAALARISHYYLEQRDAELAEYIVGEFTRSFITIGEMPGIGHSRADLTDRPFRFYRVFSYLVIFEANTSPVFIARIFHSARDVETLLREESE